MKLKRLAAMLIAVTMTVTALPVFVLATEGETVPEETTAVETTEPGKKETEKPSEKETEPEIKAPEKTEETETSEPAESKEVKSEEKLPEQEDRSDSKNANSGTEENIKWSFNESTYTLTISPKKKNTKAVIPKYRNVDNTPWKEFRDSIKKVVITKGITSIGNFSFAQCVNLTSVSLPSGLKSIGFAAFALSGIENITIPGTVTSIGEQSFFMCTCLKTITIPSSVTIIDNCAFMSCESLETVKLTNGLKTIEDYAFCECKALTSITIPVSVSAIGDNAFESCTSLTSFYIPYGVTSVGNSVFLKCNNLETVTFQTSIKSMGNKLFESCGNLKQINMTNEISALNSRAWEGCKNGVVIKGLKDNSVTAKGKTAKVKYRKLRKKNQTVAATKVLNVAPKDQKALYVKVKGKKKITINKYTGKVTVKKKLKRGTYKIKVKVMVTGNETCKASGWKTVTFKIKVK